MEGDEFWTDAMDRDLPLHRDRLVKTLAKAIAVAMTGEFEPEYQPEQKDDAPKDPETVRALARQMLARTYSRHARLIDRFRKKKKERLSER
ncbi:MAG: hypothetical protein GX113_04255 [Actinobacteria bacterium]|jgi:hypothetical protein|nr:hypothetical protein [Actinomycetota bacterium]